jgi:TolB-like protein/uncharacterized protein HemY
MTEFLQRLRQRKMAQWALAYAAGAWVLLQVLGLAGDSYEWPRIVMRLGFGLVLVGFVGTLVLAWYHGEHGKQKISGTELLILALLLVVGGGVMWRVEGTERVAGAPSPATATATPAVTAAAAPAPVAASRKSIAVLPFANFSSDKENAYFADGIQDEILTRLAKIGDLKVISRTSTLRYGSKPDDLSVIARNLGVANIVEGSVQKIGDSVRINVQLIRADTDTHLWAEIYDRKLVDVFGIQSEVATAIAQQLQATLTKDEQEQVTRKPTTNAAAYDAYLKGLSLEGRATYSRDMHTRARDFYAEAVRLDPRFVEAWSHLVSVQSFMYFNDMERTPAALASMKSAAETATRLRPGSPEALTAVGFYRYRGLRDYPGALVAFEQALQRSPNSALIFGALGYIERRLGRMEPALEHLQRAAELDPGNAAWLAAQAELLAGLRRFPEARAIFDRALSVAPDDQSFLAAKISTYLDEGKLDEAGRLLAAMPAARVGERQQAISTQWAYDTDLRHFDVAIQRGRALLSEIGSGPDTLGEQLDFRVAMAELLRMKGDTAAAKAEFALASALAERLHAIVGDDERLLTQRARIRAGLGDKAGALADIDRAISAQMGDAKQTPALQLGKAAILARFGDREAAMDLLETSLKVPYGTTPANLRLGPEWDSLRAEPRFRRLSGEG